MEGQRAAGTEDHDSIRPSYFNLGRVLGDRLGIETASAMSPEPEGEPSQNVVQ